MPLALWESANYVPDFLWDKLKPTEERKIRSSCRDFLRGGIQWQKELPIWFRDKRLVLEDSAFQIAHGHFDIIWPKMAPIRPIFGFLPCQQSWPRSINADPIAAKNVKIAAVLGKYRTGS